MKVIDLVVDLLQLDQQAEVYTAPVEIERGHYRRTEHTAAFTGEWRLRGQVVRDAMNLDRLESAVLLLVKK